MYGAADNITTLDNSSFNIIKQKVMNSKARKLIHSDALQDSHVIAERNKDRGSFLRNSKSLAGDSFDSMMDSYTNSNHINEEVEEKNQEYDNAFQNRMNKLKESVRNNGQMNESVTLNENSAGRFLPKEILESFNNGSLENERQTLNEVTTVNNSNVGSSLNGGYNSNIDYSLIKDIVETTIKKYANALNKRIINENKTTAKGNISNLKAMKIGDKFSFIAENGDIYEAKLTFKGNIKNKK